MAQQYEKYWSLTNAFTDYNGDKFLNVLSTTIDFIDLYSAEEYSEAKYLRLQNAANAALGINLISVRKALNQLVKMGFISSFIQSYHYDAKSYLEAKTNRRRKSILSKIVYSNSSFNNSITEHSKEKEINFLIKTLEEVGSISKRDIAGLMLIEVSDYVKGYLNKQELNEARDYADEIDFYVRKYNQVEYLCNLLTKLDDLVFINEELYFEDDAKGIFGEDLNITLRIRDPYLHRIYKNQLKDESELYLGYSKCMVEKLRYPVLIASHIKPFIESSEEEAYDVNNGLLLSRNMDALFDLGYISFEDDGNIITSDKLHEDVKEYIKNYRLNDSFINEKRKVFLAYNRRKFAQRNNL